MTDDLDVHSKNMNELSTDFHSVGYAPGFRLFVAAFAVFAFVAVAVLYTLDPMQLGESPRFASQKEQMEESFRELAAMFPSTEQKEEEVEVTSPLRAFGERYQSLRQVIVWGDDEVETPKALSAIEPAAGGDLDDLLAWDGDQAAPSPAAPGAIPAPQKTGNTSAPAAPTGLDAYDTRKTQSPLGAAASAIQSASGQKRVATPVTMAAPEMPVPAMPEKTEEASKADTSKTQTEQKEEVATKEVGKDIAALEKRITALEKSLASMSKKSATKSDIDVIKKVVLGMQKEVLGFIERNEGKLSSASVSEEEEVEADASGTQDGSSKKKKTLKVLKDWELRSAKNNMAWVSKKGSNKLVALSVGDVFPEIGRVKKVVKDDGRWTVRGDKGIIRQ